jgi:hypothetical protein
MFLAAEWRYPHTTWVGAPGATGGDAATDTDFGAGAPGRIYAHVPPWCKYMGWGVLVSASSGNESLFIRRLNVDEGSDTGQYANLVTALAGDHDEWRYCYEIDTTEPATQPRGAIHTNNFDGEWHRLELEWYLDGLEIKAFGFFGLPASYTNEEIGT